MNRLDRALLFALALAASCKDADSTRARMAYEQGRFGDATRAFQASERRLGDKAPVQLLQNVALAALRAHALRTAEIAAETAAARGGVALYGWRDFLLGNVAFARSERAEAEADLANADPTALVQAIRSAQAARRFWQSACTHDDRPAARRNVERALRRVQTLRRKKAAAEKARKAQRATTKPKRNEDATNPTREAEEAKLQAQRAKRSLSDQDLAAMLGRLDELERQKRRLRRGRRRALQSDVRQDW